MSQRTATEAREPVLTLALDLANRTGWALGDGEGRQVGTWELTRCVGTHCGARLARLRELLIETISTCGVRRLAMEASSFGSNNQATAAAHNELRGIAREVACEFDLPIVEHNPLTIKKFATGSGRPRKNKEQMIRAAKTLLNLETTSDDEADAAFILELDLQTQTRPYVGVPTKKRGRRRAARPKQPTLF